MFVKYVGAYAKRKAMRRSVCGYPRLSLLTSKDPIHFGYLNTKLNLVL